MKNSILFDLDGTLWEVIESTYKSVNIIAKKYSLKTLKLVKIKKNLLNCIFHIWN